MPALVIYSILVELSEPTRALEIFKANQDFKETEKILRFHRQVWYTVNSTAVVCWLLCRGERLEIYGEWLGRHGGRFRGVPPGESAILNCD